MAQRPLFQSSKAGNCLVNVTDVPFQWHAGMALSQAQKCIASLHKAAHELGWESVLEISSKSPTAEGVQLSAFNLRLPGPGDVEACSVESAFQGSKVFAQGGPYKDLYRAPSNVARKDPRLYESGEMIGFEYEGADWPLQPLNCFYDWIYLNALQANPHLADHLMEYSAFTDIAFNPKKSVNCQAHAAALYVSLRTRGVLDDALADRDAYIEMLQNSTRWGSERPKDITREVGLKFPE